ncbi:hypothetical protein Tco_0308735 [Tanacetum coccineum]
MEAFSTSHSIRRYDGLPIAAGSPAIYRTNVPGPWSTHVFPTTYPVWSTHLQSCRPYHPGLCGGNIDHGEEDHRPRTQLLFFTTIIYNYRGRGGDLLIYPAVEEDDDDEPSDDDDDDNDVDEEPLRDEDETEDEEHLAPDVSYALPVVTSSLAGDTEAFETDDSAPTPRSPQIRVPFCQTRLRRARKTVRLEPPMSPSMEARIAEYAAAPTPPSPLSPWSSPLPQIPSPPLPIESSSLSTPSYYIITNLLPPLTHLHLHLPPHVPTSFPLPSSPLLTINSLMLRPPTIGTVGGHFPRQSFHPHMRLWIGRLSLFQRVDGLGRGSTVPTMRTCTIVGSRGPLGLTGLGQFQGQLQDRD